MSRQGMITALLLASALVLPALADGDPADLFGKTLPEAAPTGNAESLKTPAPAGAADAEAPAPVSGPAAVAVPVAPGGDEPPETVHDVTFTDSGKGLEATVSVRIRGMNLATVVRLLAEQAGVNVAVGEGVTGTVSCTLTEVTVHTAIEAFLRANGYSCIERGGVLIVMKEAELKDFDKNAVARKVVRKTFRLPYTGGEEEFVAGATAPKKAAAAASVEDTLRPMLSSRGKLISYPRQKLIVVEDNEDVIALVSEFIAALWATPIQVFIDSKLLEISLQEGEDYGLRWTAQRHISNSGRFDDKTGVEDMNGTIAETAAPALGLSRFFSYGFVNANMEVVIEALGTRSRIDLQSNPSVLVMNHRTATIIVGQEVPYMKTEESTGGSAIRTVEFKEVAVRLDVTPHASENNIVFLDVHPTVKSVIGYTEDPRQPIISTREAVTNVAVASGSTLIIGGLVQRSATNAASETPFLARIPFLGALFRQKSYADTKNDLIFLLMPQIVTPAHLEQQHQEKEHLKRKMPRHVLEDQKPGKTPWF